MIPLKIRINWNIIDGKYMKSKLAIINETTGLVRSGYNKNVSKSMLSDFMISDTQLFPQ